MKKHICNFLRIIIGCSILSYAINCYWSHYCIATGGVSGLGIVVKAITHNIVPLWATNLIINLPLLILAAKLKGIAFAGKSIFTNFYMSFSLWYTHFLECDFSDDLLLVSIFGGIIAGLGVALIVKAKASTGGTDLVGIIINHFVRKVPLNYLFLAVDASIILLGMFIFSFEKGLYGILTVTFLSITFGKLASKWNISI